MKIRTQYGRTYVFVEPAIHVNGYNASHTCLLVLEGAQRVWLNDIQKWVFIRRII